LIARLKSLFRNWANNAPIDHREPEDILTELQLRGVAFFDRISEEWAAVKAASAARFERLKSDKLATARFEGNPAEKIDAFVA